MKRRFIVVAALGLVQLAYAHAAVPPIDPAQVKPDWSPDRITWESAEFDCEIEMENGIKSNLTLIRSGGRGFRHPVTGAVVATTVTVTLRGSGAT